MPLPVPVLIVEDGEPNAARLKSLLSASGIDATAIDLARDVAEAMQRLASRRYGLALVDMYLPDGMGTAVIRQIAQDQPSLQVVVVSSFGTDDLILEALRAGAVGYIEKDAEDAEIILSLACIERGGAAMSPGIARRLLQLAASLSMLPDGAPSSSASLKETPPPAIDLSPRERDVLELIAVGCTNKEVANKLGLSVHTIDFYAKRLYTKLSANSRTQAVNLARASGLLD